MLAPLPLYGATLAVGNFGRQDLVLFGRGLLPMAVDLTMGYFICQCFDDLLVCRVLLALLVSLAFLLLVQ